jgi:hypothetical protein
VRKQHLSSSPASTNAPLEGWRHVKVTDRHSAADYAHGPVEARRLVKRFERHYPEARQLG